MKITKIETQKKNLDRVSIYIDDEFAFGITDELRYKYGLKKGMEIDDATIEKLLYDEKLNKAVNYSVYLLSFRPRTEKEIRDKLIEKEYTSEQVEYAIDYCHKYKYIDDLEFARIYIRDRVRLKKHGAIRIKQDLRLKGVSDSNINIALEELEDSDYDEFNLALEVAKKRIYSYRNDDKNAQYRKLSGYLQRRGYSYDTIYRVLDEVLD